MVDRPEDLAYLLIALLLGAVIGAERQIRGHPAGVHTNGLVALGSAAFVVFGMLLGDTTGPSRIAGQVVTGVGFLCAGVMIHQRGTVRGLNTAATIWCASAVGVLAGAGLLEWAVVTALLVLASNIVLHELEHRLFAKWRLHPDDGDDPT